MLVATPPVYTLFSGVTAIAHVGIAPITLTVVEHEAVLPAASIMSSTTGIVVPPSVHPKVLGVTLTRLTPGQLSVLPPSTIAGVSVAVPPDKVTDAVVHTATGGVLSATVTVKVQVLLPPALVNV